MATEADRKRVENCLVYPMRKHRWSAVFKEKISKTQYFQILRCRYCANYLLAQFERVVLPSGAVTVKQTLDIVPLERFTDHTRDGLRKGYSKAIEEVVEKT